MRQKIREWILGTVIIALVIIIGGLVSGIVDPLGL